MEQKSRPEDLLYRMGHSTRAMSTFFSLQEEEREATLARIRLKDNLADTQAQIDAEMSRLEALSTNELGMTE